MLLLEGDVVGVSESDLDEVLFEVLVLAHQAVDLGRKDLDALRVVLVGGDLHLELLGSFLVCRDEPEEALELARYKR